MVLALLRLSPTKPDERPNRTRCVNLSSGAEGSGADLDHSPRDGRATSLYMAAAVTPVMVSGPRDRVTTDLRIQAKIILLYVVTNGPAMALGFLACAIIHAWPPLTPQGSTHPHGTEQTTIDPLSL